MQREIAVLRLMGWIKRQSEGGESGRRFAKALLACGMIGLVGAQVAVADGRPPASNAEVRQAYNGAPLVTSRQARSVPLGITLRQLVKRFHGTSLNAQNYARGRFWKICITYPVRDTGVRDPRLGIVADEWLFCFTSNNRLKRKFFWDA
jgi:hypothetical protein